MPQMPKSKSNWKATIPTTVQFIDIQADLCQLDQLEKFSKIPTKNMNKSFYEFIWNLDVLPGSTVATVHCKEYTMVPTGNKSVWYLPVIRQSAAHNGTNRYLDRAQHTMVPTGN